VRLEIVGHILSLDGTKTFKGAALDVTPLPDGPTLVMAEVLAPSEWELGKSSARWTGSGCPEGTQAVLRAVWAGGVTKPGGDEADAEDAKRYEVVMDDGRAVRPFALGDLGDGDNNHELCLAEAGTPARVRFPGGYLTDPRDDRNPATEVDVR
jgi:hypothetical protein